MLEPAIAVAVTALVMLLPLRMVNIRRLRAWAAREAADEGFAAYERLVVKGGEEREHRHEDAIEELKRSHSGYVDTLRAEHDEDISRRIATADAAHADATYSLEVQNTTITHLQGQIDGLNSAHAETAVTADLVRTNHAWHIGGKGDPHEKGVTLIRYECACGAVVYAPEGSL